MNIHKVTHQ